MAMTTTMTATFDGKVLIPSGQVDLPKGTVLHLRVDLPQPRGNAGGSLAELAACGMWADRADLGSTVDFARHVRRAVETREDHAQ